MSEPERASALDADAGLDPESLDAADAGLDSERSGVVAPGGTPGTGVPAVEGRGSVPVAVLDYVARQIVDDPTAVRIEVEDGSAGVILRLHVAQDDMGKVIGKRGRVAQSIRTLVRAAGAREGIGVIVDIVD